MFAKRFFHLLILAVAVLCVVPGSWWDENRLPNRGMIRRQADNEAPSTPSASAGPSSKPSDDDGDDQATSSAPPPAEETTSSAAPPAEETSSAPPPAETTSAAPTTSEKPQPSSSAPSRSTTSEQETTSTSADAASSTSAPPETTSSATKDDEDNGTTSSVIVSTSTDVVTKTNSDGTKETSTTITKTTTIPDLGADNDSGSSGMSTKTRNTIIGVVVGIGGAIVLGALAVVAWRIWGRKKQAEENDGLMAYDSTYAGVEAKSEPGSSPSATSSQRNPFQSTLENYHQPTHVNASSNF